MGNGAAMRVAPIGAFHAGNPTIAALDAQRLLGATVAEAAYLLGNGSQVLAQDTVPFTLWAAATYLDDYRSAILACIEGGGDVDTTAAIVGGIVASYTGRDGIPLDWRTSREPLPDFATSP
jgi:ADP-ribosylglycohydrolase